MAGEKDEMVCGHAERCSLLHGQLASGNLSIILATDGAWDLRDETIRRRTREIGVASRSNIGDRGVVSLKVCHEVR